MATNESVVLTAKDRFYDEKYKEGIKSLKEIEKLWLESGLATRKGKSVKDRIAEDWLAGRVNNLDDYLAKEGTDYDKKAISYYRNRIKDFELIAKAYGNKRKEA